MGLIYVAAGCRLSAGRLHLPVWFCGVLAESTGYEVPVPGNGATASRLLMAEKWSSDRGSVSPPDYDEVCRAVSSATLSSLSEPCQALGVAQSCEQHKLIF